MNDKERYAEILAGMRDVLHQMQDLEEGMKLQFAQALAMVASCFTNEKNHAVVLLVENEDTLKVMGINASSWEASMITLNAADMFASARVAEEMNRKGETH